MDKQIIIDAEGHINIVGKWKIGELFNVAQSLMVYRDWEIVCGVADR